MVSKTVVVLVSLIFFKIVSSQIGLSYTVKTKSVECKANPVFFTNCTCKLKPINWEKSVVNIEGEIVKPLTNVSMRIELYKFTNQYRPFVINVTGNICKWFESASNHQNAYAKVFIKMISKFSNINHGCPYTGLVKVNEMYFEPKLALFIIPAGKYKIVGTFYEGFPYTVVGTVKYVVVVNEEAFSRRPPNRDSRNRKVDN